MAPPDDGVSLGELSRRLTDVFTRFEGLARRLEDGQFVRTDLFTARQEAVNQAIASLQEKVRVMERDKVDKTDLDDVKNRLAQLEDDKKWLIRLILGFIVLGVLGAIFVASGGKPT